MLSSTDFQKVWFLYQTEGAPSVAKVSGAGKKQRGNILVTIKTSDG
jgi:hypothetical protein